MKKKIRIALIGCGVNMRIGHLRHVVAARDVELCAVADPNADAAARLLQESSKKAPVYTDYRKLIDAVELDGVLISTPHVLHFKQVKYALEHDLHVMVEKPLTIQSTHAKTLLELAKKKKRYLLVAFQRIYHPSYAYARELIQKGKLGELSGVACYVTQNWWGGGWRGDPKQSGGGFLMDTGSHLVSAVLFLTGLRPVEVRAWIDQKGRAYDVTTLVNIRFDNGAYAALSFFGDAGRHDERISIHGTAGSLVLHMHEWAARSQLLNDAPLEVPPRIHSTGPTQRFFEWIRSGGKGYQPPTVALQACRLTEAVYRSAKLGKPVQLRRW